MLKYPSEPFIMNDDCSIDKKAQTLAQTAKYKSYSSLALSSFVSVLCHLCVSLCIVWCIVIVISEKALSRLGNCWYWRRKMYRKVTHTKGIMRLRDINSTICFNCILIFLCTLLLLNSNNCNVRQILSIDEHKYIAKYKKHLCNCNYRSQNISCISNVSQIFHIEMAIYSCMKMIS